MKAYRIMIIMVLLIIAGRTSADNLVVDNLTIGAGKSKEMSINLSNPDRTYCAFQFDLVLPEGVTIAKKDNGKFNVSLDDNRIDDHTLSVSDLGNNTYRFLAFSLSNAELYGTSGALVNITLQTDENISEGAKSASISSQVFTAVNGEQYKWDDVTFSITIPGQQPYLKGDVNGDGEVTAQDASLILQYVAKKITW